MAIAPALYGTAVYDAVTSTYDNPPGFPLVELLLSGVWTNITAYVRVAAGITITRGVQDEQSSPTSASCSMVLDNRDGRFSPRNTVGAYYGSIGRNTQIRVSAYDSTGTANVRFWGYVSEWPVARDLSGNEVTTSIVANGIRRRLQQSASAIQPPYRQGLIGTAGSALVAYWPMEDGSDSTSLAAVVGQPVYPTGTFSLAASTTLAGSAALPTFSGLADLMMPVPAYTPGVTGQQVRMLLTPPKNTAPGDQWQFRVNTTGAHYFIFSYTPDTDVGRLDMFNVSTGTLEGTNGPHFMRLSVGVSDWTSATAARFSLEFVQNGTGIDTDVEWLVPGDLVASHFGVVTIPSSTFGYITSLEFGYGTTASGVVGHVSVESQITSIYDLTAVLNDYNSERALTRALRVATAAGIPFTYNATAATLTGNTAMGNQPVDTPLAIIDECMGVTEGISTESVTALGLEVFDRSYLMDNVLAATFQVGAGALGGATDMLITDDDAHTVNDVTLTRPNGSSYRSVAVSGNLTPAAIGTYAVNDEINVFSDTQLQDHAAWRMSLGTQDSPRIPLVTLRFQDQTASQQAGLVAMREGSNMLWSGFPSYSGMPSTTHLRVLGWTETIDAASWIFRIVTSPGDLWDQVLLLDSATWGLLDTDRLGL